MDFFGIVRYTIQKKAQLKFRLVFVTYYVNVLSDTRRLSGQDLGGYFLLVRVLVRRGAFTTRDNRATRARLSPKWFVSPHALQLLNFDFRHTANHLKSQKSNRQPCQNSLKFLQLRLYKDYRWKKRRSWWYSAMYTRRKLSIQLGRSAPR